MKGFIEIHKTGGKTHLINIRHIVKVVDNVIYTDDCATFAGGYIDCTETYCTETYEEIRDKIKEAHHDRS